MDVNRAKLHETIKKIPWTNVNQNLIGLDEDAEEEIMRGKNLECKLSSSDSSDWECNPVLEISDDDQSEESDENENSGNEDPKLINESKLDGGNRSESIEELEEQAGFLEPIEKTILEMSKEENRRRVARSRQKNVIIPRIHIGEIKYQGELDNLIKDVAQKVLCQLGMDVKFDLSEVDGESILVYYGDKHQNKAPPLSPQLNKINMGRSHEKLTIDDNLEQEVLRSLTEGICYKRKRGGMVKIDLTTNGITEDLVKQCCSISEEKEECLRMIYKRANIYTMLTLITDYK
ncbi:phosphoprotein [Wuhan Louse Fly Virus 5]|uniref:Phosphoprotein n=1 Tax=Wuhan Louse Fly Virus 5 TaxID=1608119 RepID=A0A0B5KXQ1_9RHAB|nr:phosphoprotein [Wuhan Louse Fly Virus 5]AJG39198.1 phosphoprotein [Wuhan Louse Fly Virus 5]